MRATLNELATVDPAWLKRMAPKAWFDRYSRRIEDSRLPRTEAKRQAYAEMVGEDGFALLARLDADDAPAVLRQLPKVMALRTAWARHFDHDATPNDEPPHVRFKSNCEVAKAKEKIESPYDVDTRHRSKRGGKSWIGYMVHHSETCDDDSVNLITHVHTTPGDVHEARGTAKIHQALADKDLAPKENLAGAAYISADLLVQSQDDHGINLIGPPRPIPNWQSNIDGAYTADQFIIDWQSRVARCPEGMTSVGWYGTVNEDGQRRHKIHFPKAECLDCKARHLCTKAKQAARQITIPAKRQYQALQNARNLLASEEGQKRYACRAGIEGTLSQAVRACGARRSRYTGLAKTHLQQVVTAAAIKLDRLAAWFAGRAQEKTRTSRFAAMVA